jgi:tetratricopeptide (TPR) repeat protein
VRTHMDEPGLVSAWGIGLIQAGDGAEGMKLLRLAQSMDPLDAVVANNMAWFLLTAPEPAVRNPAEALQVAERAVALSPRAGYIADTYAWAFFRNGRAKDALETIGQAIDLTRASGEGGLALLRGHRARILNALGRREEALKELAEALARAPREPELALEAARAYCEMGMSQRAVGELERMVTLGYPDLPNLRTDPELAPARREAAFQRLLKRAEDVTAELRADAAQPLQESAPESVPGVGVE